MMPVLDLYELILVPNLFRQNQVPLPQSKKLLSMSKRVRVFSYNIISKILGILANYLVQIHLHQPILPDL